MAGIKFFVGDDGREWFSMEVSALEKPVGHVTPELVKEHPAEYAKFKAKLEAPAVAVAESKEEGEG